MIIKPDYLKFLTIYDEQSLSKAAIKLNVYQAALSKVLSKIENELGYKLFIRTNRGILPTDHGHKLYTHLKNQISHWNSFSGEDLADGVLLYQLCFDAIGTPGNCSAIEFTNDPFPSPNSIEVGIDDTPNPTQIGFDGVNGQICIDGATIGLVFMQTPASCPGEADGDFTVGINGGTAPYDLTWQAVGGGPTQGPVTENGNTFTTPMNQSPGCYSVTVTDGNSAVVDTVCVEAPAGITILMNENPPMCNGEMER